MRLAITLGDAAGIGPEVAVKALSLFPKKPDCLMLGPAKLYQAIAKRLRIQLSFKDVLLPDQKVPGKNIACYFPFAFPQAYKLGRSDKKLATLAVQSIELSVKLARQGYVQGIVTPPINKAAVKEAGFNIPGHTEFMAALSETKHFEMMLAGGPLRVVLVTRHTPIKNVAQKLTTKGVADTILLADRELKKSFGIKNPRLVVCGLNPHAGEKGHIGREEIDVIAPAVKLARKKTRSTIIGPLPPDTVFYGAYAGKYDAEICMYHDQGLIPLKMISRGHGVNITLGLPFVRTSPDHGTAYDIAKKFEADPGSMKEAMDLALLICRNRLHV